MGSRAKTTEFLKQCLSDALVELMAEKPFESITIDEIAVHAGVGRATYFRNFHSKEELITFKVDMLLKKWFSKNRCLDLDEGIKLVLEFYYANRDFFIPVYKDKKGAEILDAFGKSFFPQTKSLDINYRDSFLVGGLIGIFGKWLKCGFKETPDEIMDVLRSLENDSSTDMRTFSSIEIDTKTGAPSIYIRFREQ